MRWLPEVPYSALSVTKQGVLPQLETAAKANDGDNRKLVKTGDFVINSRSDRKGSSGVSDRDGSVSLIYIVMQPHGVLPAFAHRLFRSNVFVEEFYRNGHGIVADLWTTRYDEMKNIKIALPSPPEQRAIADFLDDKVSKIDRAIAQKERLIELLQERKQIIIQNAVTKGLDPSVKMKDSGIEWIGQIPEHWEVKKVFHHFSAKKGGDAAMLTKEFCDTISGNYPVYSGQTANGGVMGRIDRFEFDYSKNGCLFSTTVGAKAMTCRFLKGKFSLSQNCMIFGSRNDRLDHEYFYYGFLPMFGFYRTIIPDHMQASFRMEDLYQYRFLVPPVAEQINIKGHIKDHEVQIAKAELKAQSAIQTLREYKATLIDSAVTGKIDVRDDSPTS